MSQVHDSLDALAQANVSRAQAVIAADKRTDRLYRSVLKLLKQEIVRHPERIDTWLRLINTARNLERIADHASKIAEAVVYLREGEILRHRPGHEVGGEPTAPGPTLSPSSRGLDSPPRRGPTGLRGRRRGGRSGGRRGRSPTRS